jgi:hypothetical protein
MFDILIIVCVIGVAYHIGRIVAMIRIQNAVLNHMMKEQAPVTEVFELKVENFESMLYLYDDQNNFICQANTVDELAKLSQQYKQINYAAVMHNDKIFTFVNGVASEK